MYLFIYLTTNLSIYLASYLYIYPSIYLTIYLSNYISLALSSPPPPFLLIYPTRNKWLVHMPLSGSTRAKSCQEPLPLMWRCRFTVKVTSSMSYWACINDTPDASSLIMDNPINNVLFYIMDKMWENFCISNNTGCNTISIPRGGIYRYLPVRWSAIVLHYVWNKYWFISESIDLYVDCLIDSLID